MDGPRETYRVTMRARILLAVWGAHCLGMGAWCTFDPAAPISRWLGLIDFTLAVVAVNSAAGVASRETGSATP